MWLSVSPPSFYGGASRSDLKMKSPPPPAPDPTWPWPLFLCCLQAGLERQSWGCGPGLLLAPCRSSHVRMFLLVYIFYWK